jgi:uncharacterized protein DUF4232
MLWSWLIALLMALHAPPAPCRGSDLTGRVEVSESVMSQPFVDVVLVNAGPAPCQLSGYPDVAVRGHPVGEAGSRPIAIDVRHGVYERTDPGPTRLSLDPGDAAVFSLGTGTAYGGGLHLLVVTDVFVRLVAGTVPIRVRMYATGPPGRHVPVGVTAYSEKKSPEH